MHAWPPHFSYPHLIFHMLPTPLHTYTCISTYMIWPKYIAMDKYIRSMKSLTCGSSSPPSPALLSPPLPLLPSPPLPSPPLPSPPSPHSPAVHYERCRAVIVDWPHVLSDEAMDGDRVLRNTVVRPGCVEEVLHHQGVLFAGQLEW